MRLAIEFGLACLSSALCLGAIAAPAAPCAKPVYLTFDTGHMGVAPLIAQVLQRQQVKVTFFAAHEKTQEGDGTLGQHWAPWWRARASEGHAFASHTWDHAYWRADLPEGSSSGDAPKFRIRPSAGPQAGQNLIWTAKDYCANLQQAAQRLQVLTGQHPLPLFRAPGGKTSPKLLDAARQCGFAHVGWADAGFLGDELPSTSYPNAQLLDKALKTIRAGDVLMAHLGIWSRQDPWAPAVLEPLIVGLKARGLCFATLREHPAYRDWMGQRPMSPQSPSVLPDSRQ
ncbi:polysaccharide deacetylase family protein [Limnohabitans sp. G3-2]|uniref:polysaccharide deacetylase family protein n=1 Tax=Limnohabitans sp. G3-2 TaxID=1100711 RepID=UPI000C1F58F8|nr:polysaccharide deacetylase family protein [Limnohabitans sp. G3-2]PIT78006.1 peptidase A8 [Limnohabitans sp. G3-2]